MPKILYLEKDLTVRRTKGSGPGGQHRNKTQSCIYLTHKPTGITVMCQDTRSQHRNLELAKMELNTRLWRLIVVALEERLSALRSKAEEVGVVRTYNFKSKTVKDHRTGKSAPLKKVLNGQIELLQ